MSGPGLLAQGEVVVRRPQNETFAYVTNLENFPAWFPGVADVRSFDDSPHGRVGKRYRELLRMPFGRTSTIDIEVKEVRAGEHLLTEGDGVVQARMTVAFSALSAEATKVEWRMSTRNERWWFRLFILPLLRRVMGGRARAGLRRLRENLEREPVETRADETPA